MTASVAFHQSPTASSLVPLHDFLAETSAGGAIAPAELIKRWTALEKACDIFMARRAGESKIGGHFPIPSLTALRDILPVLGREAGAQAIGFDMATAPRTFLKMVRVRQTALDKKRCEALLPVK